MQLNHKDTHEIIRITAIDTRQNIIIFKKFEHDGSISGRVNSFNPQTDDLRNHLNELINYTELAYNLLFSELFSNDYVISQDLQNWKVSDKAIRLIIPVKLINESLIEQNDLNTIIQRELTNNASASEPYLFNSENVVICYFNQIAGSDTGIVTPYIQSGEIIMQTKNA